MHVFFLRKLFRSWPVWWSFGSGSCLRHISLGAGAPPNGRGSEAASATVVDELQPFFAVHEEATKNQLRGFGSGSTQGALRKKSSQTGS